jgi:membrane associated rhomboid family serine protease
VNLNIPPGTQLLIFANVTIYLVQNLTQTPLWGWFALWPIGDGFAPWQIATYGFLHLDFWHLFFNMFAIFMFGSQIEMLFGQRWYLTYFLVCVFSAAVLHIIVGLVTGGQAGPTIGASGGVFGILLAYGMYFPHRRIMLLFPPIPMPAWLFVTGYGVLELFLGVTGAQTGVAHFAHLGGMVGGFLMIRHRRGGGRR